MRASLSGLGMVRAIADAGLLDNVRYSSSVSGGSWPNALLATRYAQIADAGFTREAVDEHIVRPFVEKVSTTSVSTTMLRNSWKIIGPRTRTDLLADVFDDWFGGGAKLGDLPEGCRWIFNATNLTNGARFGFERDRVGDNDAKYIRAPELRVADAVAASASLPGALATQRLPRPYNVYPHGDVPKLVDGAVYDNLGLEPLLQIRELPLIVVLDAGAPTRRSVREKLGVVGTVKKSSQVSARQTTTLRKRWFIEQLRAWEDWEAANPEAYADFVTDQEAKQKEINDWVRKVQKKEIEATDEPAPPMPPRGAKRGVIFSLGTTMDNARDIVSTISKQQKYRADPAAPEVPPWRANAGSPMTPEQFRTSVTAIGMAAGKFDLDVCDDLVYRGWWLTRETLRTFHPEVVPSDGMAPWTDYR
jgi:predicted acylesterase/phospholipase RssA